MLISHVLDVITDYQANKWYIRKEYNIFHTDCSLISIRKNNDRDWFTVGIYKESAMPKILKHITTILDNTDITTNLKTILTELREAIHE